MPEIVVNDQTRVIDPGSTVADLLSALGLDPAQVAVERNREIVPRLTFGDAVLAGGDILQVVTFVGGG